MVAASVAKLPDGWAALCLAREDAVERLANLALRLQSYTRSAGTAIPRSVRDRVAEELGVLRHATLELVEAVVRWQAEARAREQLRMREKREAAARRSALRREAATRGPPVGSEEALRAPPRAGPTNTNQAQTGPGRGANGAGPLPSTLQQLAPPPRWFRGLRP